MKTQKTSSKHVKQGLAAYWALLVLLQGALAGVPFNNLQGAGGVAFNPLTDRWVRSSDCDINYMVTVTRDAA